MALRYIGGGSYILGVPARDLTDEEEREHGKAIREQEKASGLKLYERHETPKPEKAKE